MRKWNVCEASAPYESDRWAHTDRGWFFACDNPDCEVSHGHYLDYGPIYRPDGRSKPAGDVHAVLLRHYRPDAALRSLCSVTTVEARYFKTPEEARAWIESEATAQQALAI